ncbi:hypothetical protein NPIL_255501 [Nephila pilipes]|uniref:Uncharacterized protein n=1 Tax=Nephila pilipes TaxID=299642 RepID=A0A8X6MLR2_NEPPI|nr:hypothetical protein NPIL_255501 [Nephila pilipes]
MDPSVLSALIRGIRHLFQVSLSLYKSRSATSRVILSLYSVRHTSHMKESMHLPKWSIYRKDDTFSNIYKIFVVVQAGLAAFRGPPLNPELARICSANTESCIPRSILFALAWICETICGGAGT